MADSILSLDSSGRSARADLMKDIAYDVVMWPMEIHGEPYGTATSLAAASGWPAGYRLGRHGASSVIDRLSAMMTPRSGKQLQSFTPERPKRPPLRPMDITKMKPPGALSRIGRALKPLAPSAMGGLASLPVAAAMYALGSSEGSAKEFDRKARMTYLDDTYKSSWRQARSILDQFEYEKGLMPTKKREQMIERIARGMYGSHTKEPLYTFDRYRRERRVPSLDELNNPVEYDLR